MLNNVEGRRAIDTAQHDPDDRLIYEASQGSPDAQIRLAELNLSAWASGAVSQLEALTGAELWARLAASSGRADAVTVLAEVLTARATFDGLRGLTDSATWYEAEAKRRRWVAGLVEREADAPPTIVAAADTESPTAPHDEYLAAAARGDVAALDALFNDAVQWFQKGGCEPIEALTATEIYARLGAARGDPGSLQRLAGVLGNRANHELRTGNAQLATHALAEGIALVSMLADGGDASMAAMLRSMVQDPTSPGVALAVGARASILAHIQPQGCS